MLVPMPQIEVNPRPGFFLKLGGGGPAGTPPRGGRGYPKKKVRKLSPRKRTQIKKIPAFGPTQRDRGAPPPEGGGVREKSVLRAYTDT